MKTIIEKIKYTLILVFLLVMLGVLIIAPLICKVGLYALGFGFGLKFFETFLN